MRVTPESLQKIAIDFVSSRTQTEHDILAAYLQGSVLSESPLLEGTADIDIYFVYNSNQEESREIVRVTDDFHLDVAHHGRDMYRQTRKLRVHPWFGRLVHDAKILYDPQHFMDFTQASVRGQFADPENVLKRSRTTLEQARQQWLSLQTINGTPTANEIRQYLLSVEDAANTIAGLSGAPLTERRFLMQFPLRANAIGKPGLFAGLLGLLGAAQATPENLRPWLQYWREAYLAAPKDQVPPRLHPHRLNYYLRPFESWLTAAPQVMLWPLLRTWIRLAIVMGETSSHYEACLRSFQTLGLAGDAFAERLNALDSYLDTVEETLETWASEYGLL